MAEPLILQGDSNPYLSTNGDWELPESFKLEPKIEEPAMDGFEVRVRFTDYLRNLNASVTSANKAAQYALKYRDFDDDLHSCILEQLENVRIPIGLRDEGELM